MSDHFYRKRLSSYLPDYGAIFMANNSTREECLARSLFGLPSEFSDFVLEVRTGMPLFLFDFERRKLYGVFEAASDGAMDIVPHAYKSARKEFPAQVRIKVLWQCDPLLESDFREAIKENFYSRYKFNFGLSRDQVCRLLYLFVQTRLKIQRSRFSEARRDSAETDDFSRHKSVLKHGSCSPGSHNRVSTDTDEQIDDSTRYQVRSRRSDNSKRDYSSPGPQSRHELKNEKENDKSSGFQVRASPNRREKAMSVFRRLTGMPLQESKSNSERVRVIMNALEEKRKFWRNECTKSASLCYDTEALKDRKIFTRLGNNVRMAVKSEQRERASGCEMRNFDKADDSPHLFTKHKTSSSMQTRHASKAGKRKDAPGEIRQKRRRLEEKHPCKISPENTSNKSLTMSNNCQGSCLSIVNNRSYVAPCGSVASIITASDVVLSNEGSFAASFSCEDENRDTEDSVDDNLCHAIPFHTSCDQDPVEMLLAEYKDYLARSVIVEDQTVNAPANVDDNIKSKICTVGVGEGPPESQSVQDASADVISSTN